MGIWRFDDSTHVLPTPSVTRGYGARLGAAGTKTVPFWKTDAWTWLVLVGCVLAVGLVAGSVAARTVTEADETASTLVHELHERMSDGEWSEIYSAAAREYRASMTAETNAAIFAGVDRKLGEPVTTMLEECTVRHTLHGTFLKARYQTSFSKDADGTETVTWEKVDGEYRLAGYDVSSNELLER